MDYKCTKCREMVPENLLEQHECSPVADLVPSGLRGSRAERQARGAVELAYLRGKQSKEDGERAKRRMKGE